MLREMEKFLVVLLFVVFAFAVRPAVAKADTITYNDFSDLSAFTLNGATASINSGGPIFYNGQYVLRLTDDLNQVGSAFLTDPITLLDGASFSTAFQFQITDSQGAFDGDGQGADGLVFVVQSQGANSVGGLGGGIGYEGISPSVGIEFDTWNNKDQGFEDNGNHVGINLNGGVTSVAWESVSTRMNNGAIWYAWIDYNGITDFLEVRLSEIGARPDDVFLSYTLDLSSILGTTEAFIGFTSGTGGGGGDHDIRSWQFNVVPEPSALFLLGSGLLSMIGLGRKRRS